jgi:transcription elongation factor GreA
MAKVNHFTEEGFRRLHDELNELRTKGRADIAKQIAEARDKGDLSENAEYDAAKDAQGLLELKISKLEEILSTARILDESTIDNSKVSILCKVTLKNTLNGGKQIFTLVAEEEADLKSGKLSIKSPIGQGILGKKVGDFAEIKAPAGVVKFEILEIGR